MPELWILLIYCSNAILHLDCVSLLKDIRVAHKQHTHFNNTSWKHSILWGGQKNPRRTQCIAQKETCLKAEREVTMLMQCSYNYTAVEREKTKQHCFLKFSSKNHYMVSSVEFNLSSSQDHKLGQPCQELMQFVSNPNLRCQSTVIFLWSLALLYCLFMWHCIAVLGAGKTLLPPRSSNLIKTGKA